jgi:hypothetical protein
MGVLDMAIRLAASTALALIVTISGTSDAVAAAHPSAPRSVAAKPGNTTVRITWVPPLSNGGAPIDRYGVQRAATSSGPWTTVAEPSPATFAWKNTGLVNGTRYYYRVRAHNVAGWGTPSATRSAVPRTVPSAPQSPSVTSGDTSATVSWSVPVSDGGAAINMYQLQISTDGSTWSNLSAGTLTHLTAGGLQNGAEYRFRVRAHNVAGWGPVSDEVRTTPGLPLPPTDLLGHPNPYGVQFDWTASATVSPAVTGYEVGLSSDLIVWNLHTVAADQTHWSVNGGYGKTYYVRVRAFNDVGYSEYGTASAISGTTPSAVSNLSVTYYPSPFLWNVVNWSAPAGGSPVQGYHVERIVTEGPYVHVTDVTEPPYLDQGVSHTTDYWYRITPFNQVGAGPASVVHFTTP